MTGDSFSARYGKIGTDGQAQTKSFSDAATAATQANKLIAEKLGKGYVEKTSVKSKVTARKNTPEKTPVALSIKSVKKIGGVVPNLDGVVVKAAPPSPVIAANPSSGPAKIGLTEPRLRLAMSRSAGVLKQLDQAAALQMTVIGKIKNEFPDSSLTKETDEYQLLRTVELAAESLDLTTIDVDQKEIDRTSTMLAGPFFTSIDFPIPTSSRTKKMTPIVQIDLRDVSELIEQPLGDGLLQLWYDRTKFKGHIRVIPRSKVNAKHVTKFDLVTGEKFDTFPLPFAWETYLKGGDVKRVTGVISHGLRCQTSHLEMFKDDLSESMSKALLQAINKFERLTDEDDELQSNGEMIGKFCGTFRAIQYWAAEADQKCLLSISGDWGSSGGAQIFYDIASDGDVKFTFWDCLR